MHWAKVIDTLMRRTHRRVRRFQGDERGSMILFGLFILILMLWAGGMGVDLMRLENQRTTLQNTLDRAVLAAADLDQTEDARLVVEDYFEKAGLAAYLDTVTVETTGAAFKRVSATASADVNTLFMNMLGVDRINAGGAATAEEGISELEISLVLDVSGSMGEQSASGNTKLKDMQDAAKEFSWSMLCNPHSALGNGNCSIEPGSVSINLVPYSEQVSAGEPLLQAINDPDLSRFNISEEHFVSSCLTFDQEDFGTRLLSVSDDVKRTGHFDPWRFSYYAPGSWTCRNESWRDIRPYVGHHSNLNYQINNLRAGGNTSIDLGMKWGTALLDPAMRPAIQSMTVLERTGGATATEPDMTGRPFDYIRDTSSKVVVLMTDGMNTAQHYLKPQYRSGPSPIWRYVDKNNKDYYSIYRASTDSYYFTGDGNWYDEPYGRGISYTTTQRVCRGSWWRGYTCEYITETGTVTEGSIAVQMTYPEVWETFTTDWYDDWSWLSNPVAYFNTAEKDAQTLQICDQAKAAGITVYTIGFEAPPEGDAILSRCATTPAFYFDSNGVNISETFATIATSINKLRLVQ